MFFQPLFKCYITAYISLTFRNPPHDVSKSNSSEKGFAPSLLLLNFSQMSVTVLFQWESWHVFKVYENPARSDPTVYGAVAWGPWWTLELLGWCPWPWDEWENFPIAPTWLTALTTIQRSSLTVPIYVLSENKKCSLGIMAFSVFCFDLWLLLQPNWASAVITVYWKYTAWLPRTTHKSQLFRSWNHSVTKPKLP